MTLAGRSRNTYARHAIEPVPMLPTLPDTDVFSSHIKSGSFMLLLESPRLATTKAPQMLLDLSQSVIDIGGECFLFSDLASRALDIVKFARHVIVMFLFVTYGPSG